MTDTSPEPFVEPDTRIANSLVEHLRRHGPSDVTMLVAYLHDFSDVKLKINGDCYNPPIPWVKDILQDDERFTKDDTDRWHLTDAVDAEPYILEKNNP